MRAGGRWCSERRAPAADARLRAHDTAVRTLGQWLDMRQSQLNTLIDVIVQGHGKSFRTKRKLAGNLSDAELERVERAVSDSFAAHFERRTP